MFDSLKKKLSGWFGKKEKVEEKPKKEKKVEKSVKKKVKKEKEENKTEKIVKVEKKKAGEKVEKDKRKKGVLEIEIDEILLKLSKLNKNSIDEIFVKCGWVEDERGDNKALPDFRIEDIKKGSKEVRGFISSFIQETGLDIIKRAIERFEEEKLEDGEEEKKVKGIVVKGIEGIEEEVVKMKEVEEIPKEELKDDLEEGGGFFSKLKKRLTTGVLKEDDFEEIFYDLELDLLENNVAFEVVDQIRKKLKEDLVGVSVKRGGEDDLIKESLREAVSGVLIEGEDILEKIKKSLDMPYVILFFGINGTGKTTSIAKFASLLKEEGISCVLVAGDTFRAASIEQLEKHGSKIGVGVVKGEYGKDPSAVAFDAIQYAKKNKIRVVLIDSAGRMYTQGNLMREMEKIVKISKPSLKIFVGESIAGNDVVEQAKSFDGSVGIDGIILSKADVDEKAGSVLSVGYVTGKPIFYLGVGQNYKDLKKFKKDDFLSSLGLG